MELYGGPDKRKRRIPPEPEWARFFTQSDRDAARVREWRTRAIVDIGIPVRITNTLEKNGILTVGDLADRSLNEMRQIQNLGESTIHRFAKLLDGLKIPHKIR